MGDEDDQSIDELLNLTWYDARKDHPTRTEYRFYYSGNRTIEQSLAGDLVVIGLTRENTIQVIITPQGSTSEQQLLWLFGLKEVDARIEMRDFAKKDTQLNFAGKRIISSLGIELIEDEPDYLEEMIRLFKSGFPKTRVFSEYARSTLTDVYPIEEPDNALIAWLEREEQLFRTLEKHLVSGRLQQGFGDGGNDVDAFISFSLSIQNRRKARAGSAFENHLARIFDCNKIHYSKGPKTERNNKPDFLFPGDNQYQDTLFPTHLLTMLGVKDSTKERWRQVLAEADRIERKHLITLEPAISKNQTDEMVAQKLQLVLPQPIKESYSDAQQCDIISLKDFIKMVDKKQAQQI